MMKLLEAQGKFLLPLLKRLVEGSGVYRKTVDELNDQQARTGLLREWYLGYEDSEPAYAVVVFSRDRPMQLHALLTSYLQAARTKVHVTVLYYASTEGLADGYDECIRINSRKGDFRFVAQVDADSFREDLISILKGLPETRLAFLVDDIIFIRDFDFRDFNKLDLRKHVPSLRLGKSIKYSYATGTDESLPASLKMDGDFLTWNWLGNDIDWAYPLSLDGNIYLKSEVLSLVNCLHFWSPNTLEAGMQKYIDLYINRIGVSYTLPRLVNIPINKVQMDYDNRHGSQSTDYLLSKWVTGYQVDTDALRGLSSNSVHVEYEPRLIHRRE